MPWIPVDHAAVNLGTKEYRDVKKSKSPSTTSEPKRDEFQQYLNNGLTSANTHKDAKNVKTNKKIYTSPPSKKTVLPDLQHRQQHVTTSIKNHHRMHQSEQTVTQADISAQGIAGAFVVAQNHVLVDPLNDNHSHFNVGHLRTKQITETEATKVSANTASQLHQIRTRVHQLVSEQGQAHHVGAKNKLSQGFQSTLLGHEQVQPGSPNVQVKPDANVATKAGAEAKAAVANTGAQRVNPSTVHETLQGTLQRVPVQSVPQSGSATKVSTPLTKQEAVVAATLPSQANLLPVLGLQARNQASQVIASNPKKNNVRNPLNRSLVLPNNNNSLKISRVGLGTSLKLKGKNNPNNSPTIQTTSVSSNSMAQLLTRYFENGNSGNPQSNNGQPGNGYSSGQNASTVTQNNMPWNFINSQTLGTEVSKWLSGQSYKLSFVGASSVVLTLIPENLGKVRLSVKNDKNGQLEVRIAASNKEALGLLSDNVTTLQQQLAASGYESVTINLGMDMQANQDGSSATSSGEGMNTSSRANNTTTNVHRQQLGNQYLLQDLHQGFIAEA
jgi:hypothetical protein